MKTDKKEKKNSIINKNKRTKHSKGITLVALVITIIVLIILAGVSINLVLGEDGIFKRAIGARETYTIASEREYLEQNILLVQLEKATDNVSTQKIGETLNSKNLDHTVDWHILKIDDVSYETGWNFVEKGTELNGYGKAQYDWLVNYETGEIIQLEDDNYISLSAGDMLAVKDSLIINVDSSIIDKEVENNEQALEKQLGDNVELVNFDYNANSGLTSTSFNFDGKNDYIKVKYDTEEQKQQLANRGFTFEFYGIWDSGTTDPRWNGGGYKGIFCYWNGLENKQAQFRFGIEEKLSKLTWNAGILRFDGRSDFSIASDNLHNIVYDMNLNKLKQGTYITITLDTSNSNKISGKKYKETTSEEKYKETTEIKEGEYYNQTIYLNGEVLYTGDYNKKQWDNFCTNELPKLKYFCIGRSSMNGDGLWHYSKMNAYCLRLYSRALSEEEVSKNYEKSVEYHSLLEQ